MDGIASDQSFEPPVHEEQKMPFSRKLLMVLVVVVVFLGGVAFLLTHSQSPAQTSKLTNTVKSIVSIPTDAPKPTPYQFYEMTIPALRAKTYTSKVSNLKEVARNDQYTSYVTSYTSDGLRIDGLLTEPAGERPEGGWPAIVFIHGYIPPKQYATLGQPYSRYVDSIASQGIAVFKIDLRGHGDSEGEPGGAYYSADYVVDALNAYNALQNVDFINPEKVGMWGHSMAGNVSLRAFATKPDIPAVVLWAGAGYSYTDLLQYRITDASYDPSQSNTNRMRKREQIRKLYGDPDLSKPFWRDLAPTSYLSDLKGAIELHHAADDNVVDVRYSQDLNALLDKTSVIHAFYEYPSGGHNITDPSYETAMQRTIEFFKKYL